MSWTEVLSKLLDFLKNPSGLGVFALVVLFFLIIYVLPIAVMTGVSWDNTNRLETAIKDLGSNCFTRNVALRVKSQPQRN